jgi:hypothetical protein
MYSQNKSNICLYSKECTLEIYQIYKVLDNYIVLSFDLEGDDVEIRSIYSNIYSNPDVVDKDDDGFIGALMEYHGILYPIKNHNDTEFLSNITEIHDIVRYFKSMYPTDHKSRFMEYMSTF